MTLLMAESFDGVTYDDIKKTFVPMKTGASFNYSIAGSGRTGNCLQLQETASAGDGKGVAIFIPNTPVTLIGGFGLWVSADIDNTTPAFMISESNSLTSQFWIRRNTSAGTDKWEALRYQGVVMGSTFTITNSTWVHVEFKDKAATSGGQIIIKIDGTEVVNYSAQTSYQNNGVYVLYFYFDELQTFKIDDFWLCDDNGSINNDFLGQLKIDTIYPNGNGTTNQWTGSDADSTDNYLHVDETTPDGDTSYVESSTTDQKDLYNYDAIGINPLSIKGIVVSSLVKITSQSGTGKFCNVCRSNVTESDSPTYAAITDDYLLESTIYETDPDTASAWTESGVNAAEFGIKVKS